MNNYQPILLKFYRRECLRKRMRKDVGHLKPKQKSSVFKCCSDWFILKSKKFRSEKVGIVSIFSQQIIRCKFDANFLTSTAAHIFSRIRGEKFASHEKIRLQKIRLKRIRAFCQKAKAHLYVQL